MKCKITDRNKIIDDYIHGRLPEKEMDAFDRHCFDCELCFSELQLRETTSGLIKESAHVLFADYLEKQKASRQSVPGNRFQKNPPFKWAFAIAGMVVILAFMIVFQMNKSPVYNHSVFQTLPYLEEMLADVSRSEMVTVFSPEIGQKYHGHLLFQWDGTGEEKIYIKILNNQGDEIEYLESNKGEIQFNKKLNTGLYYWKLESEDDLLFVGKFLVGG